MENEALIERVVPYQSGGRTDNKCNPIVQMSIMHEQYDDRTVNKQSSKRAHMKLYELLFYRYVAVPSKCPKVVA